MNIKKHLLSCMSAVILLSALAGCAHSQHPQMANELHFSLDGISDVTISYDEEAVTFFKSDSNELIIKEYMTENKNSYYADVTQKSDSIHVREGWKPFFKDGFLRYVEVYLPASYRDALTITSTNGDIDLSDVNLQLSSLRIDSTAGTVEINNASASKIHLSSTSGTLKISSIEADTLRLDTTSGNVTCGKLTGNVTYTSTSGNVNIQSAIGSGSYQVNNTGTLNVVYTAVTGDLSLFHKNGSIFLKLPAALEFEFEAITKNGSVSTTFQESITTDGRSTRGSVGSNPTVTVKAETNNGDIDVTQ